MTIDFHAHPVPEAFRKWLPLLNIDVIWFIRLFLLAKSTTSLYFSPPPSPIFGKRLKKHVFLDEITEIRTSCGFRENMIREANRPFDEVDF